MDLVVLERCDTAQIPQTELQQAKRMNTAASTFSGGAKAMVEPMNEQAYQFKTWLHLIYDRFYGLKFLWLNWRRFMTPRKPWVYYDVWCVSGRHSLGRFLYCPVSVEGLKLLLDSNQRVGKLAVVEDDDGLLDPLQQIRRQRFIFLDHLLGLDGVVEHLEKKQILISIRFVFAEENRS